MKITKFLLVIVFTCSVLVAASLQLDYFSAKSDGSVVTVEWRYTQDDNTNYFEVERSTDNSVYKKVYTQKSKADGSLYRFTDKDIIMGVNNDGASVEGNVYSYRIKVVGNDNSSNYSNVTYVTHNVSSVKRTWGMLKELFK